jgi:hypothetical protein
LCADVVTSTANSYSQSGGAANADLAGQPHKRRVRGEPTIDAIGPFGRFTVTGQTARALVALVKAGPAGVTALEVNSWAFLRRLRAWVRLAAGGRYNRRSGRVEGPAYAKGAVDIASRPR